ncbi:MAG TPA: hypothetical protein VMR25_15530 [Planctomycetaceae bacterium]|nr:hypothetical protein [Planctomycetaceae bacterium]
MRKEITVGIRFVPGTGIQFFGADEVNALLSQNWRVSAVRRGDSIVTKTGESDGHVHMVHSEGTWEVIMEIGH